ncbi:CASP-like protein PIMP1 [Primulina eburnea]|uniref:CASP-like protein PIMP1 n=1 Tax=Primulina eburnea TaxID=1245227 RepID=UPI003C6BE653
MAPPPSQVVSPFVLLILRVLTLICLLVSLILLITANGTASLPGYGHEKVKFKDVQAFKYMCAAIVISIAYTLLQTTFTVILISSGSRFGGDVFVYVDFYGDKIVSYILITGAAASFGITQDLKDLVDLLGLTGFANTVNAAAALCTLGFLFTAILSVFSSMALPKKA